MLTRMGSAPPHGPPEGRLAWMVKAKGKDATVVTNRGDLIGAIRHGGVSPGPVEWPS